MAELILEGRRVVLTRPREQAGPLAEALERLGATVFVVPLIEIDPVEDLEDLKASIRDVHRYDWLVVTSANGVAALLQWTGFTWLLRNVQVAAVGPATAAALRDLGVEPAFVPERFAAEEIAAGLGSLEGVRVLLVHSDIASRQLGELLHARGARVDAAIVYQTVAIEPGDAELAELSRGVDAIVLASGSAARSLGSLAASSADVREVVEQALVVYIGPKTAEVAREVGLPDGLVADEATADGIIHALTSHFGEATQS